VQFVVKYWLGKPPMPQAAGWEEHSSHPATRLGLHNAILAAEDRLSILRARCGEVPHGCAIFIVGAERAIAASVAEAEALLAAIGDTDPAWETLAARLEEQRAKAAGAPRQAAPNATPMAAYGATAEELHRIDFDA
jgi:hypothetical protein